MIVLYNMSAAYPYSAQYTERTTRLPKPKSCHLGHLRGGGNPESIRIATCITSDLFLSGYAVVDGLEAKWLSLDSLGVERARTEAVEGGNMLCCASKGAWNVDRSAGARWAGKGSVVVVDNHFDGFYRPYYRKRCDWPHNIESNHHWSILVIIRRLPIAFICIPCLRLRPAVILARSEF